MPRLTLVSSMVAVGEVYAPASLPALRCRGLPLMTTCGISGCLIPTYVEILPHARNTAASRPPACAPYLALMCIQASITFCSAPHDGESFAFHPRKLAPGTLCDASGIECSTIGSVCFCFVKFFSCHGFSPAAEYASNFARWIFVVVSVEVTYFDFTSRPMFRVCVDMMFR